MIYMLYILIHCFTSRIPSCLFSHWFSYRLKRQICFGYFLYIIFFFAALILPHLSFAFVRLVVFFYFSSPSIFSFSSSLSCTAFFPFYFPFLKINVQLYTDFLYCSSSNIQLFILLFWIFFFGYKNISVFSIRLFVFLISSGVSFLGDLPIENKF